MMIGRIRLAAAAVLATLSIPLFAPGSASADVGVESMSCSMMLQVFSTISERACVNPVGSSVQFRLEITNSGTTSADVKVNVATIENGNTIWCLTNVAYSVPASSTVGFDCWTPRVGGSNYQTQGNAHEHNSVPVDVFSPTIVG